MTEKRYEEAEELFEKGAEISKSDSLFSGLANIKYILRKYEETVPLFINLIKHEPKNEYYEKLTNSFSNLITLGKKQYTQVAYEYGLEGVKKFPLDKTILLNFSIVCLYAGHFAESEKYCSIVLKQDSKYPAAWSHLGLIKECLYCDEKGAQECYKKAIEYGIGHSGYFDLGISYSNLYKNWSSDEDFMTEILKILDKDYSDGKFMTWLTTVSSHQPYYYSSIEGDKYNKLSL